MSNRIEKLRLVACKADEILCRELERAYPPGTVVTMNIMHGQVTPSSGSVIGYPGGWNALLRVRLDSRTSMVRDVAERHVLSRVKPADAPVVQINTGRKK